VGTEKRSVMDVQLPRREFPDLRRSIELYTIGKQLASRKRLSPIELRPEVNNLLFGRLKAALKYVLHKPCRQMLTLPH
jgi:hypothetical protein